MEYVHVLGKLFLLLCCCTLLCGCDSEQRQKIRQSLGLTVTVKGYYDKQKLKFEREYRNGLLDGISREYYEDGAIKSVVEFSKGVQDGEDLFYSTDGKLLSRSEYRNGAISKYELFEGNGEKSITSYDANGKRVLTETYSANGARTKIERFLYSATGSPLREEIVLADGTKEMIKFADDGYLPKSHVFYNKEGSLTRALVYQQDGTTIASVRKFKGEREEVWSPNETQLLGWWESSVYYNANGVRLGVAGKDGHLESDPTPTPDPKDTASSLLPIGVLENQTFPIRFTRLNKKNGLAFLVEPANGPPLTIADMPRDYSGRDIVSDIANFKPSMQQYCNNGDAAKREKANLIPPGGLTVGLYHYSHEGAQDFNELVPPVTVECFEFISKENLLGSFLVQAAFSEEDTAVLQLQLKEASPTMLRERILKAQKLATELIKTDIEHKNWVRLIVVLTLLGGDVTKKRKIDK